MCIRDRAPYKLSPPKMEVMGNQINKLLEQGVIEPSTSSYSSPAFLVPKSNDKHRLVVDYRQLNKRIEFESIQNCFRTDWFCGMLYNQKLLLLLAIEELR